MLRGRTRPRVSETTDKPCSNSTVASFSHACCRNDQASDPARSWSAIIYQRSPYVLGHLHSRSADLHLCNLADRSHMGRTQPDQFAGLVRISWIGRGPVHGLDFPSCAPQPTLTAASCLMPYGSTAISQEGLEPTCLMCSIDKKE